MCDIYEQEIYLIHISFQISSTIRALYSTQCSCLFGVGSFLENIVNYKNKNKNIREGCKKNLNVNFFQKGGGSTPKFTLKKSLFTVKRGFKMDFFNTRMSNKKYKHVPFNITF